MTVFTMIHRFLRVWRAVIFLSKGIPTARASLNNFVITSINPGAGPTTGGTEIILTGNGDIDGNELACVFAGNSSDNDTDVSWAQSDARWISPTEIMCSTPQWDAPSTNVTLRLDLNGLHVAAAPSPFHYYESPIIESIFPSSGASFGGTKVSLRGAGFLPLAGTSCRFGSVDVPALWKNSNEITCTSPPGTVQSSQILSLTLNGVDRSTSPVLYRYTETPSIHSIFPTRGSVVGGTILTIFGRGFESTSSSAKCVFRLLGNHSVLTTVVNFISPRQLKCNSPPVEIPTRAFVHASINAVDATSDAADFEYIEDAVITSIKPLAGPVVGGTWVRLGGRGMVNGDSLRCRFGEADPVPGRWISSTEIQCKTPPQKVNDVVNVSLSLNGVDYQSSAMEFSYYYPAVILSIRPTFGVSLGGTRVVIHGSGFLPMQDTFCRFGVIYVAASFVNGGEVSCVSPPGIAGSSHKLSLSMNGVDFPPGSIEFYYIAPIDVTSIYPTWADEAGGTQLRVSGSEFHESDELACIFQNSTVTSIRVQATYVSFTELRCPAPPMTAPMVLTLRVTVNGLDLSEKGAQFEYIRANISAISPRHGNLAGGTQVKLTGSGFQFVDSICCRFGNTIVPAIWISWTLVRCESPPSSAGSVNLSYSNDGINFVHSSTMYSYIVPAAVHFIEPTSGSKRGGIEVRIYGDGFSNDIGWKCVFNEASVSIVSFSSPSEMSCLAPPSPAGSAPLTLVDPYGSFINTGFMFQYYEDLVIESFFPRSSPVTGGTSIKLELRGLMMATSYLCIFGGNVKTAAILINSLSIECKSPQWGKPEVSMISVEAMNISQFGSVTGNEAFIFYQQPNITRVSPSSVYHGFPVDIIVHGGKFLNLPNSMCRIGRHEVQARWMAETKILCRYLKYGGEHEPYSPLIQVSIASNGVDFHNSSMITLNVHPDLTVTSISPSYGSMSALTRVAVSGTGFATPFSYRCLFGTMFVNAHFHSPNKILCDSAPPSLPRRVSFWLCVDSGDCVGGEDLVFNYLDPLKVINVSPLEGTITGGTPVHVKTNHPIGIDSLCVFGTQRAVLELTDSNSGVCTSPAYLENSTSASRVEFSFSANGQEFSHEHFHFIYHPTDVMIGFSEPDRGVIISRIAPVHGLTGTNVSVVGSGFDRIREGFCTFGIRHVPITFVSNVSVICTAPWHSRFESVPFNVISEFADIQFPGGNITFAYIEHPGIIRVTPSIIEKTEKPMNILVEGFNFGPLSGDIIQCRIGSFVVQAWLDESSRATCELSFPMVGIFSVELLSEHFGVLSSSHSKIRVIEIPKLHHLEPPIVVIKNATTQHTVMVKGENFFELNLSCYFEDIRSHATFISRSEVLCQFHLPKISAEKRYEVRVSNGGEFDRSRFLLLNIILPPSINSITPYVGLPGRRLTISGNSFHRGMQCHFGTEVAETFFINSTSLQCDTPLAPYEVSIPVSIALFGTPVSVGSDTFFSNVNLSVKSIRPTFGYVTGGTRVTFSMMESARVVVSHCKFGSLVVPVISDRSELVCVSPPAAHHGSVPVGVSVNGGDFSISHQKFEYALPAVFSGMQPSSGPESGGTVVALAGANFVNSNRLACYFGSIEVPGQWISNERLICATPAMKPGNYKVRVTLNGVDVLRTPWKFTSQNEIDVLYARPSSGNINGGTKIFIVGKSFSFTDYLSCKFGDFGVSRATFISSSELMCISPRISGIAQHIDVGIQISLNGADFSDKAARFRLTPESFLREITPNKGTIDGGTQVTVKGVNFLASLSANDALCIFGNESVSAALVSSEEMTCVSPPHAKADEVGFAISMNGVDVVRHRRVRFQYLSNIKNITINPSGGPFAGGTLVTVTGTDFSRSRPITCKFGSAFSDGISYISDQIIQCLSPPHPSGTVSFSVMTEQNEFSFDDAVFEYYKSPTILFASPTSGPKYGGTVVRIYGSDFRSNVEYFCKFGDVRIAGVYIATDAVQCESPSAKNDETVYLDVAEKWSNMAAGTLTFSYAPPPSIVNVTPRYVFADGGDTISVFGHNLNITHEVWCRFTLQSNPGGSQYSKSLQGRSISKNRVDCQVPPYPLANMETEAFVEISTNGQDYGLSRLSFFYAQKPKILGLYPTLGSINGGTVVTVTGTNFIRESKLWCVFGYTESPAEWKSDHEIICISPSVQHLVNDTLSLHFKDNPRLSEGSYFYAYHQVLTLEGAYPTRGFVSGGTIVTIQGKAFIDVPSLSCYFGNIVVAAKFMSINSIECQSPKVNQGQEVELKVSLNGIDISALPATADRTFTYDEEVDLFHTIPSVVPVPSDPFSYVTVIGSSFINSTSTRCQFGRKHSTDAQFVSAFELRCGLPKVIEEMNTDIRLSFNGFDFCRKTTSVLFIRPPLISSVVPERIPERQEVEILVRGQNFVNSLLQCRFGRFGHLWSPAQWMDNSTLKCVTPLLNASHDGLEYVGVSVNGGHDRERKTFPLHVVPRVQFLYMHPALGYVDGGTEVVITFGNAIFFSNLVCQFESEAISGVLLTANSVVCKSPAYRPGKSTLKLMSGKIVLASESFEYILPPIVTSLHPSSGAPEGGAMVRISGASFLGVTYCRFRFDDDIKIVRATVESDQDLSCDSPASDSESDAAVELSHNGQDFIGTGRVFKYRSPPRLHAIAPSFGSDLGGTRVYASGNYFVDAPAKCRFGLSIVDAIYLSPILLQCVAPAMEIGFVPVSISLNGVNFMTNTTLFYESIKLPQIHSIAPRVGPVSGGTKILLKTTALHNDKRLACHFGEEAAPASFQSSNSALCVAPRFDSVGDVTVSISVGGERLFIDSMHPIIYTYVSEPKVTLISPNFGWTTGGEEVSLSVEYFGPFKSSEILCSFGEENTFAPAVQARLDLLVCRSPPYSAVTMMRHTPISLRISDGLNELIVKSPPFTYHEPSLVTSVEPSFGSIHGGSVVRVNGFNFPRMPGLKCLFGEDIVADSEFIDDRKVVCILPKWRGGARKLDVHIGARNGQKISYASNALFEYLDHPAIKSIRPRFGSVGGGTSVTLLGNALSWPHASQYLSCRFGNSTMVSVESPSKHDIVCTSPPGTGTVPVSLYANHGQLWLASSDELFVYTPPIELVSLSPNTGPATGGTIVAVSTRGLHLLPNILLTCHFGNDFVTATLDEEKSSLKCTSPPVEANASTTVVLVYLGINGSRDIDSVGCIFTYYRPPSVIRISPTLGFADGGEDVRIYGKGFRNSEGLGCKFGGDTSPKVVWISDTVIICTTPLARSNMINARAHVQITNNGMDYTDWNGAPMYVFTYRPDALMVEPRIVNWNESTNVTIKGKHLIHVSACWYGIINKTYQSLNATNNSVTCEAPSAATLPISLLPSLSRSIPIFLHLQNGIIATGLHFKYAVPPPQYSIGINQPDVVSIFPSYGSTQGGDWVRVQGEGFLNTEGLACRFGEIFVKPAYFVSASEVHCRSPTHVPGDVIFNVVNSRVDQRCYDQVGGFTFTFLLDVSITTIVPSFGSINGGTVVNVFGSFPSLPTHADEFSIVCKFGMNGLVTGEFASQNEIRCLSSPSTTPGNVEVSVSLDSGRNFAKSTTWFAYVVESRIKSLYPSYGYPMGGTSVVLVGSNFWNTTGLKCLFGESIVDATFQTSQRVSCLSPPLNKAMNGKVAVKLVSEGRIMASWKYFEYVDPPQISSIYPLIGQSGEGDGALTIMGSGFLPMMHLFCSFGKMNVRGSVVDDTTLLCEIPRHPNGVVDLRVIDQHAIDNFLPTAKELSSFQFSPMTSIYSVSPSSDAAHTGSLLLVRGTNFDVSLTIDCRFGMLMATSSIVSDSLLLCPNLIDVWVQDDVEFSIGAQEHLHSESYVIGKSLGLLSAPNGTVMDKNFTLCEPGTFKSQSGPGRCMSCPIGFICPLFGLSTPVVCPAGWICDRLALPLPSSKCISGHYCNEGTKTQYPMSFSSTDAWNLEEDSGVFAAVMTNKLWDYIPRKYPATGARQIFHPPIGSVTAEQPIPCPVGYFCWEGVSSAEYREGDYSTPQPCSDGFFCSKGSTKPVGTGACPTGYYCPTQVLAIPCEPGHYCPGTGNVYPLPCFPGSYSSTPGQSSCTLCEIGFQCPGFNRTVAEPCQAGWVCDEEGLSIPSKRCPSGFICEEGTTTDDPSYGIGIVPKPCPAGSFCLGGVAHNSTSSWLPSFEMGMFAPQPCLEGYFCPSNSSTPVGGGRCFPGSYCPESSPFPVKTPPGAFSGDGGGAIFGSLCLPGKFSPRSGQITCSPCPAGNACLGYGTYVPRICGPGTYRSKADSIQSVKCKACPDRTYSFDTGLTDISQCLPCAEGRVCGLEGMIELKQSDACSEGSVCGYTTTRSTQFLSRCPSGSYCGNATTTAFQYSNDCPSGHFCQRGTSTKLKTKDKCTNGHYCVAGTPEPDPLFSRCPRQTSSRVGATNVWSCTPKLVAICDKMASSDTNPYDQLSYYPSSRTIAGQEESNEKLVLAKIVPFDLATSDVAVWMNDTVEVFRTCPSYGILPDKSSAESRIRDKTVTIIGRNFINSTTLTCRYKICLGSRWVSERGVVMTTPGLCRDQESSLSESMTKSGVYISKTRVSCPLHLFDPEDEFLPVKRSDSPSSLSDLCLRDEKGQTFLSQRCSEHGLESDNCSFEADAPLLGLRKRLYSLVLSCSEDEIANGHCAHIPIASSKLNPCLTQQMMVDISNTGGKFSGDGIEIPYTSLDYSTHNHSVSSYRVIPTYAIFDFILEDSLKMFEFESSAVDNKRLKSSFEADRILCDRSSVHEEGQRRGEHGWIESPYMSRFHLSFDWRHLPDHLVYNMHFRLAIYVFPSRCVDSKCSGPLRNQIEVVHVPCLQPIDLPARFGQSALKKHQLLNLTLLSLEDSRFRVEVQVVDGLAIPLANLFKSSLSVVMEQPRRAYTVRNKRRLSPFVSPDEKFVEMPYIFGIVYDKSHSQRVSLPKNLPPRWDMFERGRVLIGVNSTDDNAAATIEGRNLYASKGSYFWDNPYHSPTTAKRENDLYFETFHGVSRDGPLGSYKYQHSALILPYLPYFSKCNEFDSHIPLWALLESSTQCQLPGVSGDFPGDWWRRKMPPLVHEDDVQPIGPMDYAKFYPVADWCERELHCTFDEDLANPDVTPRWFEAETGTALFSIIRDPIDYFQYTGRDSTVVRSNDGGGQRFIDSTNMLQMFIPAKVDRSSALYIEGGCAAGACFPRKVTVDLSYYQVDSQSKRIVEVKVIYDEFDKDPSNDRYDLQIKYYALTYEELVNKFAFSRGLFLLLFTQIGVGTVGTAAIYWAIVRLTTNLERPPRLRVFSFFWLSFSPAIWGYLLGLVPIIIVTGMVYYLMKGYLVFTPVADIEGRHWLFPSTTRLHYSDIDIEPEHLQSTRQGRTGLAFVTMGLTSLYWTSKMFVPLVLPSGKEDERDLVTWKRGNLILSSLVTSLFLIIIVEWSFSASFGTYIWEAQIFLAILSSFVEFLVNKQLGDYLLGIPVMTAVGLVQIIVTMSANDFMDFLLSHIVGFGFLIIVRMYKGPVIEWLWDMFISLFRSKVSLTRILGGSQDGSPVKDSEVPPKGNSQTVEPLLESYASFSSDTLNLLHTPFIMFVLIAFRDEVEVTKLYGIKEDDMVYYVIFALAIIPFQILADIFFHNALELLHGWKILEYLEYCNVRFLQREVWWKGFEKNTFDECIDDSLRSIDQLCFSCQYYMLNTVHLNAMLYFILGIEMITRAEYTVFGDPIVAPLAASIILFSVAIKMLLTSIARRFGLWKIKHEQKGWHSNMLDKEAHPKIEQTEAIQVGSQNTTVEQCMTSERFRYKFLSYNRSWILSQLPELMTPRVCDSQKPYMINQIAQILSELNEDGSSDSGSDSVPEFNGQNIMTETTRTLARTWLDQAVRQLSINKLVQPLILQAKGNECLLCLSRNHLQVELLRTIAEIDKLFRQENQTEEIDHALFKRFWKRHQQYQTICRACVQKRKISLVEDEPHIRQDPNNKVTSRLTTQSTESIMISWFAAARQRLENYGNDGAKYAT